MVKKKKKHKLCSYFIIHFSVKMYYSSKLPMNSNRYLSLYSFSVVVIINRNHVNRQRASHRAHHHTGIWCRVDVVPRIHREHSALQHRSFVDRSPRSRTLQNNHPIYSNGSTFSDYLKRPRLHMISL